VEIDRTDKGELYYIYHAYTDEVPGDTNKDILFRRDEILHIPGLSFNGLVGFSPIAMMKNSLGTTMAVEKYGSSCLPPGKIILLDLVPLLRRQIRIVGCEQASAVDIGSLTHRFLRLIDLSAFRGRRTSEYAQIVEDEIIRMRDRSILTEAEAKSVFGKGAADFLSSELGQRLIDAPSVEREWPSYQTAEGNLPYHGSGNR
jgi:hypothetical protein